MSERGIERKFVRTVKEAGGITLKFVRIGFVEVKDTGKKPRPLQVARHRLLAGLGFRVFVLDRPEQIPDIILTIGGEAK